MSGRWKAVLFGFWVAYQVQAGCAYQRINRLEQRIQTLEARK